MLKICVKNGRILDKLTELLNNIRDEGIPMSWRKYNVLLIPKTLNRIAEAKQLRPIAINDVFYKVYTEILLNQII